MTSVGIEDCAVIVPCLAKVNGISELVCDGFAAETSCPDFPSQLFEAIVWLSFSIVTHIRLGREANIGLNPCA